ncbi:PAS domain-containing protein [Pyxidicoccus sp. 3LG]
MSDLASSAHSAVFEHSRDAVLVLDSAQRIREVNRAAERYFGPRGGLVGLAVTQLLPGWRPPEPRASSDALHERALSLTHRTRRSWPGSAREGAGRRTTCAC